MHSNGSDVRADDSDRIVRLVTATDATRRRAGDRFGRVLRNNTPRRHRRVTRYGAAVLAAALGLLVRLLMTPEWGITLPFITLYPAIAFSAWFGGFGPGLLTTGLGAFAVAYFWPAHFGGTSTAGDMLAIALFGGAHFASRRWAVAMPLVAMLASDIALALLHGGLYMQYLASAGFALVYAAIALSTLLGFGLRGKVTAPRLLGYSLAGSLLFFAVTNFGAWLGSPMYPQNAAGLAAAYVAGIPFFQGTVLGTLVFGALLFGGFGLLRRQHPALHAQTV